MARAASRVNRMRPPVVSGVKRPHRRLRLLQPEGHAHLAVHRSGGGQMLLRLVAGAAVELAQTQVAVGDERAHPEVRGQRKSFPVASYGGVDAPPRWMTEDVPLNPQRIS